MQCSFEVLFFHYFILNNILSYISEANTWHLLHNIYLTDLVISYISDSMLHQRHILNLFFKSNSIIHTDNLLTLKYRYYHNVKCATWVYLISVSLRLMLKFYLPTITFLSICIFTFYSLPLILRVKFQDQTVSLMMQLIFALNLDL